MGRPFVEHDSSDDEARHEARRKRRRAARNPMSPQSVHLSLADSTSDSFAAASSILSAQRSALRRYRRLPTSLSTSLSGTASNFLSYFTANPAPQLGGGAGIGSTSSFSVSDYTTPPTRTISLDESQRERVRVFPLLTLLEYLVSLQAPHLTMATIHRPSPTDLVFSLDRIEAASAKVWDAGGEPYQLPVTSRELERFDRLKGLFVPAGCEAKVFVELLLGLVEGVEGAGRTGSEHGLVARGRAGWTVPEAGPYSSRDGMIRDTNLDVIRNSHRAGVINRARERRFQEILARVSSSFPGAGARGSSSAAVARQHIALSDDDDRSDTLFNDEDRLSSDDFWRPQLFSTIGRRGRAVLPLDSDDDGIASVLAPVAPASAATAQPAAPNAEDDPNGDADGDVELPCPNLFPALQYQPWIGARGFGSEERYLGGGVAVALGSATSPTSLAADVGPFAQPMRGIDDDISGSALSVLRELRASQAASLRNLSPASESAVAAARASLQEVIARPHQLQLDPSAPTTAMDIRIVPPAGGAFVVEVGRDLNSVVRGSVVVNASSVFKDATLVMGLRGTLHVVDGDKSFQSKLVSLDQVLHEGQLVRGSHNFEFKLPSLPPSLQLADGAGSVVYTLKAAVTYTQMMMKKSKQAEAPICLISPGAARARLLAMQTPLVIKSRGKGGDIAGSDTVSLASSTSWTESSDVFFQLKLSRRVLLPGDLLKTEITLQPSPNVRIADVTVSLRSKARFHANKNAVDAVATATRTTALVFSKELAVVAAVREPPTNCKDGNVWNSLIAAAAASSSSLSPPQDTLSHRLSITSTHSASYAGGVTKTLSMNIPATAVPSYDAAGLQHTYSVRMSVTLLGVDKPVIVVDAPVVIVARGTPELELSAVPPLTRSDSKGRPVTEVDQVFGEVEDGVVLQEVLYPFAPPAGGDEIALEVGQRVRVSDRFEDGWGCGLNHGTGAQGFFPLHHLTPIVDAVETSGNVVIMTPVSPPASPRTLVDGSIAAKRSMESNRPPVREKEKEKAVVVMKPVIDVSPVKPIVVDGCVSVTTAEAHLGLLHRLLLLENPDQLSDWRYLCRAEQRYLMWLDFLREEGPDPESSMPLPPIGAYVLVG
ncbi:hypothetical protein HK101_006493 [Irineochytrium annulatum]|nr:hypothetical protein HK101_006493 [Irineochytrium annulatum]